MSQISTNELPSFGLTKVTRLTFSALAILAFAFCALTEAPIVGYALGAVTVIGLAWRYHMHNRDRFVGAQVLVLAGLVMSYDEHDFLLIAASVLIAGLLLNQELFIGGKPIEVANLSGPGLDSGPLANPRVQAAAHSGLVVLVAVAGTFDLPVWPVAALTALVTAVSVAHVGREALRKIRRRDAVTSVRAALDRHQPEFAIYFSAPPKTEYQVMMWLPYLERVGRPFMIILREPQPFATISAATSAPVVICNSVPDLDNVVVPSLKTVFYVNNGMKNAHMVRFSHLTHVQLLHGDSDKASSYNPITVMFDRVYVAGPAAIDRYAANGVSIEPEKFVIVGRPQVEPIEVAPRIVTPSATKTVMYGTTWAGIYSDANYCSLHIGPTIVKDLLSRGVTVIFRPHPYVGRNPETRALADQIEQLLAADRAASGRQHVFGRAATECSLWDCFNRADALISDVSGIASDFLYSEKPLALTDMVDEGDDFVRKFPVAKAAYVLRKDGSNLSSLLDELLETDTLDVTRRTVKQYYLGDFPAETYAQAFVEAARRDLISAPDLAPQPV